MVEKNAPAADSKVNKTGTDRREEDRRKTVSAPRTPRVSLNTMVATPFGVISLGIALHEWDWAR